MAAEQLYFFEKYAVLGCGGIQNVEAMLPKPAYSFLVCVLLGRRLLCHIFHLSGNSIPLSA